MKSIAILLMTIVILVGLLLALTPFAGSLFFSSAGTSGQMARPEMARMALADWFKAPPDVLNDVQGIRQSAPGKQWSRFSFSTSPNHVRSFIQHKHLVQKPLTAEIMQHVFTDKSLPWWQPEALQRETWFTGEDQGNRISLIYNAQSQRGVLVIQKMQLANE